MRQRLRSPPSSPSTAGETEAPTPPPSSPSTAGEAEAPSLDIGTVYVVRDVAGNCAVVDHKPSASSGLKILDWSSYAECKEVVEKEALIGAVEQGADDKFKAAQTKAEKLGGVEKLTAQDIEGLSADQLKQLRGY